MDITVDDLSGPEIAEFLQEHVRQMRAVTPLESKHALDLDALRRPEITFWTVRDGSTGVGNGTGVDGGTGVENGAGVGNGGAVVGCGAIKRLDASHAELKSMRTAPKSKRSGVASLLLGHILTEAARMGFTRMSLETGSDDFFLPARGLYEKFGFVYCEPFADYRPDPNSVFMTKQL